MVAPSLADIGTPPTVNSQDPNGYDPITGEFSFSTVELAIGPPGAGGLVYGRNFTGSGSYGIWQDSFTGYIKHNINVDGAMVGAVVSYNGTSVTFDHNGGVYSPRTDSSVSLTKSGQIYTFTSRRGEIARFSEAFATNHVWEHGAAINAVIIDITRPNGEVITYHHVTATNGGITASRIQSVTNSYGYQVHFEYLLDNPQYSGYKIRTKAIGLNATIEFCATTTNVCSGLSQNWPTVSYEILPGGSGNDERVTYSLGYNRDYLYQNVGSNKSLIQIKRHSGTVATTYSYGPGLTIVRGGVTYQYSAPIHLALNYYYRTLTINGLGVTKYVYTMDAPRHVYQVERVNGAESRTTGYGYDANGRVSHITAPGGRSVTYDYDSRGNVIKVTQKAKTGSGLADIVTEAGYPACNAGTIKYCNKPAWTKNAQGYITDFTYSSSHGGLTQITAPAPTGAAPYGSGNRPQTRTDYATKYARYKTGTSTYSNGPLITLPVARRTCTSGNNSCVGEARETVITTSYQTSSSPNNILPLSVTTAGGNGAASSTVTTAWDVFARPISGDGPLPGSADSSSFQYDALGRVVIAAGPDPDGAGPLKHRATRTTYNSDGFVTMVEQGTLTGPTNWASFSALGRVETQYDSAGRPIKESRLTGSTTHSVAQYSYNSEGALSCQAYRMDPAKFTSLPASACSLSNGTTPDRITARTYNDYGELVSVLSASGTSAQHYSQRFTYTSSGAVATLKDAGGNLTSYEYDGFDRQARTYYPHPTNIGSASTTDYEQLTYDSLSRVTARRLRSGESFTYGYDNLGRPSLINAPGSDPDVSYSYDQVGRPLTASQTGHTLSYTYDAQGRMLSETGPKGAVAYQYDAAGNRTRIDYPGAGGFYVTYVYNSAGDITQIREKGAASGVGLLAQFAYDDWGRRTSLTRGNGVVTSYAFDAASRLATLTHNLAGSSHDQTLGFTYNTAHQITGRSSANSLYDPSPAAIGTDAYLSNGLNQLTSVGGAAVTHDSRGNMTAAVGKTYGYDYANRLKSVSGGVALAYDPQGRLSQQAAGGATDYLYDGADIIGEYSGATVLRRYVHGPGSDEPLVQYDGTGTSTRTFLIADERGSIIAGTNSSGAQTYINRYDAYGRPETASNMGLFQYTGQIWLASAELYHYKARAYHPGLGRFMQTDPIGYAGGMNLYAYVGNDPVNATDPSGLIATTGVVCPTDGPLLCPSTGIDPFELDMLMFLLENRAALLNSSLSPYLLLAGMQNGGKKNGGTAGGGNAQGCSTPQHTAAQEIGDIINPLTQSTGIEHGAIGYVNKGGKWKFTAPISGTADNISGALVNNMLSMVPSGAQARFIIHGHPETPANSSVTINLPWLSSEDLRTSNNYNLDIYATGSNGGLYYYQHDSISDAMLEMRIKSKTRLPKTPLEGCPVKVE